MNGAADRTRRAARRRTIRPVDCRDSRECRAGAVRRRGFGTSCDFPRPILPCSRHSDDTSKRSDNSGRRRNRRRPLLYRPGGRRWRERKRSDPASGQIMARAGDRQAVARAGRSGEAALQLEMLILSGRRRPAVAAGRHFPACGSSWRYWRAAQLRPRRRMRGI